MTREPPVFEENLFLFALVDRGIKEISRWKCIRFLRYLAELLQFEGGQIRQIRRTGCGHGCFPYPSLSHHAICKRADSLDSYRYDVAGLKEARRLETDSDSRRRSGRDYVGRAQG